MNREEKMAWMAVWAVKNKLQLDLEGEVGFGRECVGILAQGSYPAYSWDDENTYERLDNNGEVWTPEDAYHKGPYVAVLGRGEEAESQLYEWLKWFDDNNFKLETGVIHGVFDPIKIMLGQNHFERMVRQEAGENE